MIEAPLCSTFNQCYTTAASELVDSDILWAQYCSHCRQACQVIDFGVTMSGVNTLAETTYNSVKAFVENKSLPLATNWSQNWPDYVLNNYISFEVVCQSPLVENFNQEPTTEPVDVLSDVGGQTGLWIGVSFLSIMELVEMLFRLLRRKIYMIRGIFNNRH